MAKSIVLFVVLLAGCTTGNGVFSCEQHDF